MNLEVELCRTVVVKLFISRARPHLYVFVPGPPMVTGTISYCFIEQIDK